MDSVHPSPDDPSGQQFALPIRPDAFASFRTARLLILLEASEGARKRTPLGIDRLGYYDFLADNPFLVFPDDDRERVTLLLAGFSPQSLSYQSVAQRFANRRARLQHDIGYLLAAGVVNLQPTDLRIVYGLTAQGRDLVSQFRSMYADGYRRSARLVVDRLNRKSDSALERDVREWLRAEPFLLDLFVEEDAAS